jgi:SAM-dependent methyltransferase
VQDNQDQIFLVSEGNKWFERNKEVLERFDPQADFPLKLMDIYGLHPHSVLEVGAANGFRLAAISERFGCRCVAVEPSADAISDGKARFPSVEFVRGGAYQIPLQESFDLIIVNFVFHWIDRTHLLRSVAEIDRILVTGGFLIIGDFAPLNLIKVPYHHLANDQVYTYKQNYAAIFLASGLYHTVGQITGNHASKALSGQVIENERIGVWLLRRMLTEHYVDSFFKPERTSLSNLASRENEPR